MQATVYTAYDQDGKKYIFDVKRAKKSTFITLKKEALVGAKQIYLLGDMSVAQAGDEGYYLISRNDKQNGDIISEFVEREDVEFIQQKMIMSFYGIKKKDMCVLVRVKRRYPFVIRVRVENGRYELCVRYDLENFGLVDDVTGMPAEDIEFEIVELPLTADYNEMARTERCLRLERGEILPLAKKCERECVEYARKYPLIRIRMAWKKSPCDILVQTPENEPEPFVACDFARVRDIADELARQGVEGAELQLVGWNKGGHDGAFPQLFPINEEFGGEEGFIKTIEHVKALGYRISTHTNTIDAYQLADSFTWDDILITKDGNHRAGGLYGGGQSYKVCAKKQYKNALRDLPALQKYGENGLHFTDVLSIVEPLVCYSKDHPCSHAEAVEYTVKNMDYTRELFGGFCSEGCMDFAIGSIDYGLYVTFGDGFGRVEIPIATKLLPVWEIVYHGTVLYNPTSPTVNYPIKQPKDRLTFVMRGGKPSIYIYSRYRAGAPNWMGEDDLVCYTDEDLKRTVSVIKKTLDDYKPLCHLQLCYMQSYEALEGGIEIASYENGTRIVGNFSDNPALFEGMEIEPYGYAVIDKR